MIPEGYEAIDLILTWRSTDPNLDVRAAVHMGLRSGRLTAKAFLHGREIFEFKPPYWISSATQASAEHILRTGHLELDLECEDDDEYAPVALAVAECKRLYGLSPNPAETTDRQKGGRPPKHDPVRLWQVIAILADEVGLDAVQNTFIERIHLFYQNILNDSSISTSILKRTVSSLYKKKREYSSSE